MALRKLNHDKLMARKPYEITRFKNQLGQEVVIYEHPTHGDEHSLLGVIDGVAFDTEFYDCGDWSDDSGYNPVLFEGVPMCMDEYEDEMAGKKEAR